MKEQVLRQLDTARHKLESGQIELARSLATAVLKSADDHNDPSAQGEALMALSQFDRVLGRFRRAIETSSEAAGRFQLEGDIAGEASALSLLSHANSYLGRDEEAVEAALLSVKLGDLLPPGALQINLNNYLGVAYLCASSFANAESAFHEAERLVLLGRPAEPPSPPHQPGLAGGRPALQGTLLHRHLAQPRRARSARRSPATRRHRCFDAVIPPCSRTKRGRRRGPTQWKTAPARRRVSWAWP